ncbi:MAG: hypothetical protein JWQ74_2727 [Marmoricola sp.]|nr:hypothetical protein [Marmoricola sp.]
MKPTKHCAECSDGHSVSGGKTLYDKTVARRVSTSSRRTKRATASVIVLGLFAVGGAASLAPAQADQDFSGFTTFALATPLRVEIYEPAIPIPASPNLELNFSYTKVNGTSGPSSTARGSALWPGDSVGEGLKTFGEQLGLPGALTDNGYPVQINAQTPGDTASATQEFFPGNTGKVSTTDKKAIAKVGYGTAGDVAEGDVGDGKKPTSPSLLDLLQTGDLSAIGGILTGALTGKPGDPQPSASPLGGLSALVNVGGMESVSTTDYDPDSDVVTATATARLGTIGLIGGLVKLDGVEVVTKTTSNIAKGAKTSKSITIGGMSIAGQKFGFSGTSVVAQGKDTPIPGLPDAPAAALKALGLSFELGKSVTKKEGPAGSITAEGLRISIDTQPLLSKLPKLPLGDLVSQLPDLPGQANILKGLIIALGEAHPRIDLVLGQSQTSAQTIAGIDPGTGNVVPPTSTPGTGDPGTSDPGTGDPVTAAGPVGAEEPPSADNPGSPAPNTTPINPLASVPGLPPLGGLKTWLVLLGALIAAGAGWYLRRAGLLLFGGASTCVHGLKAGIPDLRKV